jgi:predicted aldo/keto reductase-like oxidoreductase
MANGVNYFDTAYPYHGGESEKFLGETLPEYPRDSYYLATKFFVLSNTDYKAVFEEQLSRLKTDDIDFYMIHGVTDDTYQKYTDNGCIEYFSDLKRKGLIKYFGFSSHAGVDTLTNLVNCRSWDFAMIQLNYYDWVYGSAKKEYEILKKHGLPVMVMEPLRGGRLASLSPESESILKETHPDWSVASLLFRWVKGLPGIQTIFSSMQTIDHLKENIVLFSSDEKLDEKDEEEKILFRAVEKFREEVSVLCTSCMYCINDCPAEINIPKIIELYNYYKTDKPWDIKKKIEDAESKGKPADCISCGVCLSRCPQKIDIMNIMQELNR